MNLKLSVSLSKEMGGHARQGIEFTTFGFHQPLLYLLSYKARQVQVTGDYGGNCGNDEECCELRDYGLDARRSGKCFFSLSRGLPFPYLLLWGTEYVIHYELM